MNRMRLGISAGIIGLIVFIAFALSVPHTRDFVVKKAAVEEMRVPVVSLHDVFRKGMHTISGSVMAVNACSPLTVVATLAGDASTTPNILVALTLEKDTGVCLQVPTRMSFQTTLAAPAGLLMQATVNGVAASTTPI